jgi:hypothetical protein
MLKNLCLRLNFNKILTLKVNGLVSNMSINHELNKFSKKDWLLRLEETRVHAESSPQNCLYHIIPSPGAQNNDD